MLVSPKFEHLARALERLALLDSQLLDELKKLNITIYSKPSVLRNVARLRARVGGEVVQSSDKAFSDENGSSLTKHLVRLLPDAKKWCYQLQTYR